MLGSLVLVFAFRAAPAVPQRFYKIPRVPVFLLHQQEANLRNGGKPFILTHATIGWRARMAWNLTGLMASFADSSVEHYPNNLLSVEDTPTITTLASAVTAMNNSSAPQYVIWKLQHHERAALLNNTLPFPAVFSASWIHQCLSPAAAAAFLSATAWNMVIIGTPGSGMFFHADSLQTSTWQAQIRGSKQWVLCPPEIKELVLSPNSIDPFERATQRIPAFSQRCKSVTVNEGEMLYYPRSVASEAPDLTFMI